MSLVSQSIKNFIAGVSQQPAILRHPEQVEEQINGYSTETGGLQKRPPTLHLSTLDIEPHLTVKPKLHFIKRDKNEQYVLIFTGEDLFVYDLLTGKKNIVQYDTEQAKTYIKTNQPRTTLKVTSIADYTFIVNREITIKMKNTKSQDVWSTQGLLINIKSGQYGRTYKIVNNGTTVATYTTPDGSQAEHVSNINTDYIVDQLATSAQTAGYTVKKGTSWLYLTGKTIKNPEVYDGYNNQAMVCIYKITQKFTNLPANAPDGFVVKIYGEKGSQSDDYYVKYDASDGIWKETLCPNIIYQYDLSTMPHTLIRQADGTFLLKQGEWTERKTGDEDSNPLPSFIDNTINDVFFFRNRLGFLSGENIILSSNSDFFNFFIASAVSLQETDAIDVAVSDNKVSTLYQAVPHGEDLIVFSGDTQFSLRSEGILTPTNVKVDTLTYFSSEPNVKPIGVGRNIYFTAQRSYYTTVKEYFTAFDNTDKRDAQDITSHVPNYIPNGVYQLIASTLDNLILFLTEGDINKIYVYKFLFLEGIKQQSSWSVWDLKDEIIGASFIDSTLYLIMKRGSKYHLEKMLISYNTKDFSDEPYRAYIDRKIETPAISSENYDSTYNLTSVNLSDYYDEESLTEGVYIIINSKGVITRTTEKTANLLGDYTGQTLIIGKEFSFITTLSPFMLHTKDEEGKTQAITDGRLQLQHGWLNYEDTGAFEVKVDNIKNQYVNLHSLYTLNSGAHLDNIEMTSGIFKFPIQCQNTNVKIQITSDHPTPISFVGGGWKGRYTRRYTNV